MDTKPLLYGMIGFFLGGLLVAIAANTFDRAELQTNDSMSHMSNSLMNRTGDNFDRQFLAGMIVHHQGAVDMARLAQKNAKHQEIKDMSEDIISAQNREIATMKQWQKDWGYKSESEQSERPMMH